MSFSRNVSLDSFYNEMVNYFGFSNGLERCPEIFVNDRVEIFGFVSEEEREVRIFGFNENRECVRECCVYVGYDDDNNPAIRFFEYTLNVRASYETRRDFVQRDVMRVIIE